MGSNEFSGGGGAFALDEWEYPMEASGGGGGLALGGGNCPIKLSGGGGALASVSWEGSMEISGGGALASVRWEAASNSDGGGGAINLSLENSNSDGRGGGALASPGWAFKSGRRGSDASPPSSGGIDFASNWTDFSRSSFVTSEGGRGT